MNSHSLISQYVSSFITVAFTNVPLLHRKKITDVWQRVPFGGPEYLSFIIYIVAQPQNPVSGVILGVTH